MASSSSSEKVFSGAELTKGGFAKAPDHLRNVIVLLHEVGLNYVLEEPCRVLNIEVGQFFDNARMDKQQRKLRSKVNGVKIKMTSLFLNRFLRMPTDDVEEIITVEDTDRALAWCNYQGKKASALKKNAMNEEARFLADIIGKVFMCKPGSHDHISSGMFELMTAVVLRKKRNWGADLFRFIAGCLSKPSFGRIISLFICQSHPESFSMSKGLPIHHHKKISMLTLERVKRRVPQDWRKAPKKKPANEQVISEDIHLESFVDRDIKLVINRIRLQGSNAASTSAPVVQDNSLLLGSITKMIEDLKRDAILERKKMVDEVVVAYNKRLSEFQDSVKISMDKFGDNLDHLNTFAFKQQGKHGKFVEMQAEKAKTVLQEEVPPQQSFDVQVDETILILDEPAGTSSTAVETQSLVDRVKNRVGRNLNSIYSPSASKFSYSGRSLIPSNDQAIIDHFLNQYPSRKSVIVDKECMSLYRSNIEDLLTTNWINDESLDVYGAVMSIKKNNDPTSMKNFLYVSSKHANCKRNSIKFCLPDYITKTAVDQASLILIPVYLGAHWALLVGNLEKKAWEIYDSLPKPTYNSVFLEVVKFLYDDVGDFFPENILKWKFDRKSKIPKQDNGHDCGVFVMMYMKTIVDPIEVDWKLHQEWHKKMPQFRAKIVLEIIKALNLGIKVPLKQASGMPIIYTRKKSRKE